MAAVRKEVESLNDQQEVLKREGKELRREMGAELAAMEAELEQERRMAKRSQRTAMNDAAARSAERTHRAQQELAAAHDDVERECEARAAAEVKTAPAHVVRR